MFGYKLAAKPADKGHPFGHGRMEYLTSLVIAVMIALMGFELLRNSVEKIIHPDAVQFRWLTLGALVLSIGGEVVDGMVQHPAGEKDTLFGDDRHGEGQPQRRGSHGGNHSGTAALSGDNASGGRYHGYGGLAVYFENGIRYHT